MFAFNGKDSLLTRGKMCGGFDTFKYCGVSKSADRCQVTDDARRQMQMPLGMYLGKTMVHCDDVFTGSLRRVSMHWDVNIYLIDLDWNLAVYF